MKKVKSLVLIALFLMAFSTQAQLSVNVNLGTPPVWAPANRQVVQYYYLPEVDSYYDVPNAQFISLNNGRWIRSKNLPYKYRNYNLRGGNVVYLTDYRGNSPYKYHESHKVKYYKNYRPEYKHEDKRDHDDHKEHNGKGHKKH